MVRAKTIAIRHLPDLYAILQSLRNNAGLHLIWPPPMSPGAKDQIRMCEKLSVSIHGANPRENTSRMNSQISKPNGRRGQNTALMSFFKKFFMPMGTPKRIINYSGAQWWARGLKTSANKL